MRSSIIETLCEDYITTARAKGITDSRILRGHALPNAMLPTVSLIAINLGFVVAGAITVEVVFNWPGLGTLTVDALKTRDYPVLQGIFLVLSISVVVANLVADIVYGRLDPAGPGMTAPAATIDAGPVPLPAASALARAPVGGTAGRAVRARHHRLLRRARGHPGAPRRAAGDRHDGDRWPPRATLVGIPARHRRARPRHPQPDRPRRPDLDGHRVAGDGRSRPPRRGHRHRRRVRRRQARQPS